MKRFITHPIYCLLIAIALLLTLGSCRGREKTVVAQSADPPLLTAADARFSWDAPTITPYQGERMADIAASPATLTLQAQKETESALGLFAVDPLVNPMLDGVTLLDAMPIESAFVIQPDGSALFTYADLFDPEWRERTPDWRTETIDGQALTIDYLADDPVKAKVARDADLSHARDLLYWRDEENTVRFYWSGVIDYCFQFGRPVNALALTDPAGERKTTLETAPGFRIRISAGGNDWTTLWTAVQEGVQQPEVSLPPSLVGAQELCLRFDSGEEMAVFRSLYVTAGFQDPTLAGALTRFAPGQRAIRFEDDASSSHRAILFWDDPAIRLASTPIAYPEDAQIMEETADALRVRFPQGVLLEFHRTASGQVGGLRRMVVGQQTLLQAPPGASWRPAATLTMLDGQPTPPPPDFKWSERRDRYVDTGEWSVDWSRSQRTLSLAEATFDGANVQDDAVILAWTVTDGDQAGRVELIFAPVTSELAGATFAGVSVRARVSGPGLTRAQDIRLAFPLSLARNDWWIEQMFRRLVEETFTFQATPPPAQNRWFTESQSFVLRTGPGRTALAFFDQPTAAVVRLSEEEGRHRYEFHIPLGAGATRETSPLYWLLTPAGAEDRWAANDIWAQLFDTLKNAYSQDAGVIASRPVPSVVWNAPTEDDLAAALGQRGGAKAPPVPNEGWFDHFTREELPRAAAAGVRNLIIQPPWESDFERPPETFNSGHAAWDFTVSPLWGGEEALKRLVEAAHARGVQVTLWYPSAFSLFSPLIEDHPDWLAWEITGEPLDGGWRDIVSPDPRTGYGQYAVDKIAALHDRIPFDGLWFDSWAGLSVLTDYGDAQPAPTLDAAIALQRAYSDLGLTHILIEGLGPLGRPDAYGDYERYAGPPDPNPTQVRELERLRGHEYLLHRMGAGTYIDMAIYHRALAAGGLLNIANFDEIDALSANDRAWLGRINREHRQVVDRMDRRKLLVVDDRWVGVAWTADDDETTVIFAFEPFRYRPDGPTCVRDLSQSAPAVIDDEVQTQAWRTYLLWPGEACQAAYLPVVTASEP